jgi:dihydrofolate synthase / folylpolyglutamate synthase
MPQRRFASVHVVGTNGKSSVATLCAALLERAGMSTGTYLSPHADRWAERVVVGGREIGAGAFAAAVERVAEAVPAVERRLAEDDVITQFEAATAAAFIAFAAAGVEVAVVEAGLGGRLDATNVLPSRVTALTTIGLEHTEYLGETELEIAAEKLAVLQDHSVLVAGELSPEVAELARRTAGERSARLVGASEPIEIPALSVRAPYLSRNLAVAAAVAAELAGPPGEADLQAVAEGEPLQGRMEVGGGDPPVIRDAAHNPDGARALAEGLAEVADGRPVVACLAVLAGKDAEGMLAALAPLLDVAVCTEIPGERLLGSGRPGGGAIPAERLAEIARAAGIGAVEAEARPEAAIARAVELAGERDGVALVAGSHYLLGYGS